MGMQEFVPLVVQVGWTSVLALLITDVAKIVIVRMAIKDVPAGKRAAVLRAVSYLFLFRGERGTRSELRHRRDGPPEDTGQEPGR
jgi:hypothetical protein